MTTELISWSKGTIAVDIVKTLSNELTAEEPDYATENADTRTDTKIHGPGILSVEVNQTETPLEDPEFSMLPISYVIEKVRTFVTSPFLRATVLLGAGVDAARGALGFASAPEQMEVLQTRNPRDRGNELFDKLQELWLSTDLAEVTFAGRSYPNMSLLGLSLLVDQAGLKKFQLTFKQRRIAKVTYVQLPNPADIALKPSETGGKNTGSGGKEEEAGTTRPKSLLKMGLDGLGL